MKVVGFKALKKDKKKHKNQIVCIPHFFRNGVIILGALILLMVFGIFNTNFSMTIKDCIQNFVSSMRFWF
ncbi:MAG: hypothetical protein KBT30_02345 [Clostridiales bacterium]|nr:hypothetical protein [Candidatus Apopatousia equi]